MESDCCKGFVATVGTFDGLHLGHQQIMQHLMQEANSSHLQSLVVTFDRHPRQALGRADDAFRLLSSHDERMRLIADAGVDRVEELAFTPGVASLSACQFLEQYLVGRWNVRTLLLGYDNSFGSRTQDDFSQLPEVAQRLGVRLITDTPYLYRGSAVSSTRIRQALSVADMQGVQAMLGRTYSLSGRVVKGRGVGRSLQFPTANIEIDDPLKAWPAAGVYAVKVSDGTYTWGGMTNLGTCPTFGISQSSFEVHLFHFRDNLYGRHLSVQFLQRVRDIVRFDSPEALAAQLTRDREQIQHILSQL